jgi:hypothetical protein
VTPQNRSAVAELRDQLFDNPDVKAAITAARNALVELAEQMKKAALPGEQTPEGQVVLALVVPTVLSATASAAHQDWVKEQPTLYP